MKDKMKKILKTAVHDVLFFVGLALLLMVASQILQPKDVTVEAGIEDIRAFGILAEPENSLDAVIMGDSECYAAFNPLYMYENYGIASYVSGTRAEPLCYTSYLLDEILKRQKPEIIFVETNCFYRKFNLEVMFQYEAGRCFSAVRYHDRWKSLTLDDFGSVDYHTQNKRKGCYCKKTVDAGNPDKFVSNMKETTKVDPIFWINRLYIERLVRTCEKNDVEIIFLSTPSIRNWNYKRHNAVSELADEYGVTYIDMNMLTEEIPIDWKRDTRDKGDHLNCYGSDKVSEYLGQYLSERGMEDHRDEEEFRYWDDLCIDFHKEVGY